MSSAVTSRDPDETAATLDRYLSSRLGVEHVAISELAVPKAGFSNETILGRAAWTDAEGPHDKEFVLRIQPTGHQLFVTPDAIRQAHVVSSLAGHVPVPNVWLTDADPAVFGAPFYLMERTHGRVPSDVPTFHKRGWVAELPEQQQRTVHENGLRELVRLHGITDLAPFQFLDTPGDGATALERYVRHIHGWYEWCAPVRVHAPEVIDRAMEYALSEMPKDDSATIVWGDARMGNIMFADDLSVAAMFDWEGATLGPPEIDVAWWVLFDEFLCESRGATRLPGIAGRRDFFAKYEEFSGRELRNIEYYSVLGGLVLSIINSRLADLLVRSGASEPAVAAKFVTWVTDITTRHLDALG